MVDMDMPTAATQTNQPKATTRTHDDDYPTGQPTNTATEQRDPTAVTMQHTCSTTNTPKANIIWNKTEELVER